MFSFSSEKDCYRKRVEETEISQDQAQVRLWLYFREISHTIPTRQLASEIILDITRVLLTFIIITALLDTRTSVQAVLFLLLLYVIREFDSRISQSVLWKLHRS